MENDSIVITAKLNVQASQSLIEHDLDEIQKNLKPIEIKCAINDTALKNLQDQLGNLSQNLNINVGSVNAQSIQNSINEAVKADPIKINVEAQINSGEIKRQAKELKEMWGIDFAGESKESVKALNAELQNLLVNYDKAKSSYNFDELMSSWEKISEFVQKYSNGLKQITPEMEKINAILSKSKIFISEDEFKELKHIYETRSEIQKVLNNTLGVGKWSYDSSKASYGFDSFVQELNSNLYKDSGNEKITESIVEGLEQIAKLRHADVESARQWDQELEHILSQDANAWETYKNAVLDSLYAIRGEENPAAVDFIEIINEEELQQEQGRLRDYTEILEEGKRKIEALKAEIMSESGSDINSISSRFTSDAAGNIEGFVLAIQKSNGEVENLYHRLTEVEDESGKITREWERTQITGSDKGAEQFLTRLTNEANKLERSLVNAKSKADDLNAPRPIKSEEGKNTIAAAYNEAIAAIEKLRTADKTTFDELDNEAKKAIDNFNNIVRAQRNVETAATKLRAKPIEIIKEEEASGLDQFVAKISKSAVPNIDELKAKVEDLRTQLNKLGENDKQGLANYLDQFSLLESEFKAVNEQARVAKAAISELNRISNSAQFTRNAQNPDVQASISDIEKLKAKYQELFEALGKNNSPAKLQEISTKLTQLKPQLDNVIKGANNLNQQLRNMGADNTASANLEKLKNQMVSFSNANLKAVNSTKLMRDGVTTFAQGWQDLLARLNSGTLDAAGIQKLTQDFQVFKGEVNAVGLSATRVFTNMGSQLRMLATRYISLYAVVGYIKKMVTSVKELDTAMINVKRVTDETAESYQKFLTNANELARELHTTTSTLVESVYQWSKLGYDLQQSLDLAKSSTIFAKVADIDESTAITEMVATMKAFNIEAEKSIDIVDKLDILNNKFAVSASGLGEGLERSASALAMTGNSLEQTLAMLTGAGEVTQNLENTGNALKIMSLR